MRVHVERIKDSDLYLDFHEPADNFAVLNTMIQSGECEFTDQIHVQLRLYRIRDMIEVEGTLTSSTRVPCSRCLNRYEVPLKAEFALTYTRELPDGQAEVVDLREEDIGLIVFHGDEIDLRDGIQEQAILALPFRPICRENCKGLCPQCGADLNRGKCDCDREDPTHPFAALKKLKLDQ